MRKHSEKHILSFFSREIKCSLIDYKGAGRGDGLDALVCFKTRSVCNDTKALTRCHLEHRI